ncbi:MAG TPA: rhodanese-like domain-containing protein [Chitinophagaceae bacterium]|nr:rhodanese-like domain-containing protein [Chitinophagaceae bacterium]MCB9054527.1 rhodanese-like domain-containing protein [Chitinophagales bacterium]HPG10274.1 rhodanese-like domain-containing protein [Chitinophagaceae bacterium]
MNSIFQSVKRSKWIFLSAGFLFTAICGTVCLQAQNVNPGKTVTQEKFQRLMKKKKSVVLDVRTVEEYKDGHVPGARQIDVMKNDEFKNQVATLDKNKTYLLYCRSGKRSQAAMKLMKEMGFTKLYDLSGGFSGWTGEKEL